MARGIWACAFAALPEGRGPRNEPFANVRIVSSFAPIVRRPDGGVRVAFVGSIPENPSGFGGAVTAHGPVLTEFIFVFLCVWRK